ncbi:MULTISPECIES: hypothetical protein [Pseudomonas]|jgi:hypothetical protein|uniref:hypothetical protein n=1 Tax=Pseudomonas TaxID=286 RepID=UPI000D0DDC29|nr:MULTISPECIES: hypothetical protein [Pseudomonas]MBK3510933.1 hypothetical protein [Pseudomonas sp. MF6747]MBT0623202.1 hypothetical protein [Pseudomonas fluorescens]PSL92235.1 hypothetical protein C7U57_20860 [Pseudomonas sp. R9.37]QJI12040.1 hypothetical protein HKK58_05695 [Pseudomonas sp. ADAK22]
MSLHKLFALVITVALLGGCNALAGKTNMLSDDDVKSQSAGALGYAPADLTIVNRQTQGTNTYVLLKTNDNKQFNCIINGGNIMTFGMSNPPSCAKKGEQVKSGPFGG